MLPAANDNNELQIVQGPGYVALLHEIDHSTRVIPTDGRPHLSPAIRQWQGDSVGHWEENTLVVDTTNFNSKIKFRGATENMHLTERFTRTGPSTIVYRATVDDPSIYTKPWTIETTLSKRAEPIYEYACHEGNYGMFGILSGERAQEKTAAAKAK